MSLDTLRIPPPPPPLPDPADFTGPRLPGTQAPGFDAAILDADRQDVGFEVDAASIRIGAEDTSHRRTSFTASGEVAVTAPGHASAPIAFSYGGNVPADTTPAQMRAINPFDPATLPENTSVSLDGGDFAGTPFEAGFRQLAGANDVPLEQLRLQIVKTGEGELRVMSGPQSAFDDPKAHGPSSQPLDREDFTTHALYVRDAQALDVGEFNDLLLTGSVPDGSVALSEDVASGRVDGSVTDLDSGERNEVAWTFDANGRPTGAEATLTWEPGSRGRDSDAIEARAQSDFREDNHLRNSGDHVGHIFAYRFVNGHGPVNMFPQDGNFNTSAYVRLENEWADWLGEGMDLQISIRLTPEGADRPDQVSVDYEVIDPASGALVYDPQLTVFDNQAGQVFERIARSDMDDLIANAS